MSAGKKTIGEKLTTLFENIQRNVLGKILYYIRKYFIMWDVQTHSAW